MRGGRLRQKRRSPEHEHPAIPQILSRGDIGVRRSGGPVFDELCEVEPARSFRAAEYVAVAGLRPVRHDARTDEQLGGGCLEGVRDRRAECLCSGDHVIGGQHRQQRFIVVAGCVLREQCSDCDCRRGVSAGGLRHHRLGWRSELAQLLGDEETMGLVADDHGGCDVASYRFGQQHGFLKKAVVADEAQELLRLQRTRQRPQARAGAAGQYHGYESRISNLCRIEDRACRGRRSSVLAVSGPAARVAFAPPPRHCPLVRPVGSTTNAFP